MKKRMAAIAYSQFYSDVRVIREARAAVEAGFEVEIFSLKEPEKKSYPGITVKMQKRAQYKGKSKTRFLLNYVLFFFFCFWQLTKNQLRNPYQVIHVHNMPNFLVFAGIIPKLAGAHIILDIHDVMPELFAEKFNRDLSDSWIKLIYMEERLAGKFADTIISTNRLITERLRKNGINKKEFYEILNAADETMFPPNSEKIFNSDQINLIFPSTIAQRLGLDTLLDAMKILKNKQNNVKLKIFGMGEYAEAVKTRIIEEDLSDLVTFPGLISFDELNLELDKAHIGVLPWPSGHSTNFQMPIKVHEYFIKGLCVVAADVNIIKEYFSDCVIMFDAGNAEDLAEKITLITNNKTMLAEYANRGHEFSKNHSWSYYKSQYISMLNKL